MIDFRLFSFVFVPRPVREKPVTGRGRRRKAYILPSSAFSPSLWSRNADGIDDTPLHRHLPRYFCREMPMEIAIGRPARTQSHQIGHCESSPVTIWVIIAWFSPKWSPKAPSGDRFGESDSLFARSVANFKFQRHSKRLPAPGPDLPQKFHAHNKHPPVEPVVFHMRA